MFTTSEFFSRTGRRVATCNAGWMVLKFKVDASGLVSSGRSVNHLVTLGNGRGPQMGKLGSNCFNFHAAEFLEICCITLPKTNISPLKVDLPKKKIVSQLSTTVF